MDNYKMAFIYGQDEPERNIEDGMLHFYGEFDDEILHSKYLLDYAKEYYPDVSIFEKLTIKHQPEVIAYFLIKMGHIVFLNTTKLNEKGKKHGKIGIFLMPDTITEKQKETLISFANQIEDYDVMIAYDIKMIDGMLDSQSYTSVERIKPIESFEKYFEKTNITTKHK